MCIRDRTIPAQFSKKYKCEIVPIYIERLDGTKFKIIINKPMKFKNEDSIKKITTDLNLWLESMILKNPSQWIEEIGSWIRFIQVNSTFKCPEIVLNASQFSLGLELTNDKKILDLNRAQHQPLSYCKPKLILYLVNPIGLNLLQNKV